MTRRHLLLALGVALTVLAAAGGVWWAARPRQRIDREHCERVKLGMRLDEVETIFGVPPGDYRITDVEYFHTCPLPLGFHDGEGGGGRWEWWTGDEGQAELLFDADGRVCFVSFAEGGSRPSLADLVQHWLHRAWRALQSRSRPAPGYS